MSRTGLFSALGLLAVAGVALVYLLGAWPDGTEGKPVNIAKGRELYAAQCASCHGENMEGEPDWRQRRADGTLPAPPHDASGHTWHHPDQQLFDTIKFGTAALVGPDYRTTMRAFGPDMSDADIRDVIAYIKSTWPPEIRRRQERITARANNGG